MPEKAWAYYSSAAEDEITHRENHAAYHRKVNWHMAHAVLRLPEVSIGCGGGLESYVMSRA